MSAEFRITTSLKELARVTSRRGLLERLGKTIIGVALLPSLIPKNADAADPKVRNRPLGPCANCGGCSSQLCGTTGGTCCVSTPCRGCNNGQFCDNQGRCGCPPQYDYGWYWYCCSNGRLWECNDCCYPGGGCACTNKCNSGIAC
jgi:hypothetical protein